METVGTAVAAAVDAAVGTAFPYLQLVEEVKQESLRVLLDSDVDRVAVEVLHSPEEREGVDRLQQKYGRTPKVNAKCIVRLSSIRFDSSPF